MTCCALVLFPTEASSQSKESYAVMDLEGRGISALEAATLTDRMRSEMVKTGAVTVVERGQMQSILAEQDFQMTGCTSDECAVEIGQMLGITKMIAGSIGKIGSTFTVDLRTINIGTGAIENTMTRDYKGEIDGLITTIERAAHTAGRGCYPTGGTGTVASGSQAQEKRRPKTVIRRSDYRRRRWSVLHPHPG
jgi:hypothetical protein